MISRCVLLGAILGVTSLSAVADDWPQYRGPGRDNKVTGFTPPATWPKELKKEWSVKVGDGVSSPALVGDKLYVFTRVETDDVLTCLDAKSGKEIWKEKYASEQVGGIAGGRKGGPKFTGPRSSPAVAEGKVCTLSVAGIVTCFDAATGKIAWQKMTKSKPQFSTSTSPLIANGKCIVHIGSSGGKGAAGKGDLMAYDLADGEAKWKWTGDGPGYASPVLATIKGVKQIVELTDSNLIGVNFEDGKLLWKTALRTADYQSATPVIDGDTVICGGNAYAIEKSGDSFEAKRVWKERDPTFYNTPVLKDGVEYGLIGGGKGGGKVQIFARDAKSGMDLWTDTAARGECGTILDAGSTMILLSNDANLVAFKPSKDGFTELAKYKVAETPTCATPVIAGKRIYVKDFDSITLWSLE